MLYRSIKNLEPYITMSYSQPAMGTEGWTFGDAGEPLLSAKHLHHVYTSADDMFTGRCTVPVLWDKKAGTIVNNESADIIRMFDSVFDDLEGVSQARYYNAEHATEIDQLNDLIDMTVNNGVYRCGFSQSQDAYEQAYDLLFNTLDELDTRLANQRYRAAQLFQAKNLTAFVEKLAQLPLQYHPGEQWHYSVAVDVTGLIVERLSGMPLDQYLEKNIFQPLGMADTFFSVPADKMDRFLPNHYWDRKGESLKTIGADAGGGAMSSYTDVTLFSGGGGLVSTAHDYMRFAEMLRAQGSFKGNQILSPKTVKFMTKDHLPKNTTVSGSGENPLSQAFRGFGFGLGFGVITDVVETQASGSEGSFMWGGAAGTIFWVDPEEDLVALCMIQLMGSPWPLREELRILTYQALTESLEE